MVAALALGAYHRYSHLRQCRVAGHAAANSGDRLADFLGDYMVLCFPNTFIIGTPLLAGLFDAETAEKYVTCYEHVGAPTSVPRPRPKRSYDLMDVNTSHTGRWASRVACI